MGQPKDDEEGRPLSSEAEYDAEETLPLYEDTGIRPTLELKAPPPTATPDEVRDFLVQVLQSQGNGTDRARRIAAYWTVGTGLELRLYPVHMYRDIFGGEDAWMVYRHVRLMIYKEEEKTKRFRKWIWVALFFLSILNLCGSATLLKKVFTNDEEFSFTRYCLGFLGFVFSFVGIGLFANLAFFQKSPEKRVEQELVSQM